MAELGAESNVAIQEERHLEAAEFILRLGNALLQAGYPINQIGELLLALSHSLELPQPQVYVTPTVIEVTIGPLTRQHRALLVTTPGDINLGQLTQLDTIGRAVAAGTLSPHDGIARLEALSDAPPLGNALLVGVSYALTAAAFARTLGGGIREILVAALVGGVTGVLAVLAQLFSRVQRIFPPLAAFIASLLISAWAARVTPVAGDLVTLAGLFVLLPGFTLTVALEELASRDLVSGTVRMTSAFITLFGLILGVALGRQFAERLFGPARLVAPATLPAWTYLLAALLAGLSYTLWLQVERRDIVWVVLACVIGATAARAGVVVLGPQLGAFAAALVVGLASNLFALLSGRPAAVMQVPGLIVLVPRAASGYRASRRSSPRRRLSASRRFFRCF
jgi:uncharacterized membrane protein YjjP (DUF1212 family)